MKQTIKQFFLILGITALALMLFSGVGEGGSTALAQTVISEEDNPVSGISGGATNIRDLVLRIVQFFLGFLGLLAVVMIIYAGFLYLSAAGNEEKLGQAKKIILYAVIGIIVIAISFALVSTLIGGLGRGTDRAA